MEASEELLRSLPTTTPTPAGGRRTLAFRERDTMTQPPEAADVGAETETLPALW